ncbi:MAG: hydantoinase/oxoprolinase family protein [Gammaproteobacteria bacterium]|nr:hydantoinase/oxoprolinase family protein [Gammaproteobacteria bacterium]MCY4281861.1 hydantoinase/oxoprolinase family protein [Gammaproteobacteria bacterium]MCY4338114.1 hydantoinase/oxoprolinase family protein [Gammaproteobacteria bacterium]
MRVGVDVGGTNTDAVLMQGRAVLAAAKAPTSADVVSGMISAIRKALDDSGVAAEKIGSVMVGTTQFINAFVERKHLSDVAIMRIALPMTAGIPPLVDWPDDLRQAIDSHIYMIRGGCYYTGQDYLPADEQAIVAAAKDIARKGIGAIALTSIFSPIRPDIEERAAALIRSVAPDVSITLSHQLGGLSLIERENACIINASLLSLARTVMASFRQSLQALNIKAELYVTQNDGTLMRADYAEQYPVMTCSAGPTNSMRGAGFLSDLEEAIVIDIGGTSTDVGFLKHGFPRESTDASDVGGVRTNFNMPDVLSVGLGGGSIITTADGLSVGPQSVGNQLLQEARIFGGQTLTATDIAVALGQCELGDKALLNDLPQQVRDAAMDVICRKVETAIDRIKTNARAVPAILVGGGHILLHRTPRGVAQVHRPEHATVANAIGAAMAQVGARIKRIVDYSESGRETVIDQVSRQARAMVVKAGGIPATVTIVEIEEMPMTHIQNNAVSLKVRAVGDLAMEL